MDSKVYRICGFVGYMESKSRNVVFSKKDSELKFEYRIDVKKTHNWSAQVSNISMPVPHRNGHPLNLTDAVAEFFRDVDLVVDMEEAMGIAVGIVVSNICCIGKFCFDSTYDV